MRFLLQSLAIVLVLWAIVSVIGCEGSVPFCMGKTAKYVATELWSGASE
jgi:hypothetical protein